MRRERDRQSKWGFGSIPWQWVCSSMSCVLLVSVAVLYEQLTGQKSTSTPETVPRAALHPNPVHASSSCYVSLLSFGAENGHTQQLQPWEIGCRGNFCPAATRIVVSLHTQRGNRSGLSPAQFEPIHLWGRQTRRTTLKCFLSQKSLLLDFLKNLSRCTQNRTEERKHFIWTGDPFGSIMWIVILFNQSCWAT